MRISTTWAYDGTFDGAMQCKTMFYISFSPLSGCKKFTGYHTPAASRLNFASQSVFTMVP
jgi:hypothetical protein